MSQYVVHLQFSSKDHSFLKEPLQNLRTFDIFDPVLRTPSETPPLVLSGRPPPRSAEVGDGPFRPLSDPLNKKFMDRGGLFVLFSDASLVGEIHGGLGGKQREVESLSHVGHI